MQLTGQEDVPQKFRIATSFQPKLKEYYFKVHMTRNFLLAYSKELSK